MIEFKEIDESNFDQIIEMSIKDEDKTFVAPNVKSLAQAWLYRNDNDVFPYAIYYNHNLIGFILLDIDIEEKEYMIWRMMIDQEHQGKGYGRASILKVIEMSREHPDCDHLIADYVIGNNKMKYLLESIGFKEVGKQEDCNEVIMRMETL